MLIATAMECIQITRPENFGAQFGNFVTTWRCESPIVQDRWADFFTNPSLLIGALAAAGTVGAVVVALKQSSQAEETAATARSDAQQARIDAIEIADRAESAALRRELRINELERFEDLMELVVAFASSAKDGTDTLNTASVKLVFGLKKYFVYLSQTESTLVIPFSRALTRFQMAIDVANEYWNPIIGTMGDPIYRHIALREWFSAHPNLASDFVSFAGQLVDVVNRYYDQSKTLSETLATLDAAERTINRRFEPLIEAYDKKVEPLSDKD